MFHNLISNITVQISVFEGYVPDTKVVYYSTFLRGVYHLQIYMAGVV